MNVRQMVVFGAALLLLFGPAVAACWAGIATGTWPLVVAGAVWPFAMLAVSTGRSR